MTKSKLKPKFAIVGCGKVGTALAINLGNVGYKLTGLNCATGDSIKRASKVTGCQNFSLKPWDISKNTDIVFITTPDTVINEVYAEIAAHKGFSNDTIVLHCSGALSSTILNSSENYKNIYRGSIHPLQSFVSLEQTQNPFTKIIMSVEGDDKAVEYCRIISEDLGSTFIKIKTESKLFYHASAVVASNFLVTLLDFSFQLIEEAGVSKKDAFKILTPLINGTLSNVEKVGVRKALTGPIVRGDVDIVQEHLNVMKMKRPELVKLYKILGQNTVNIAIEHGLDKSDINAFKKLFEI